jgi:glutamyl endopeptidase
MASRANDERPEGMDPAFGGYRPREEVGEEPMPNAWYASYDDPGLDVLSQRIPNLESLEIVLGRDDRQRVENTTIAPFKWVASLEIEASDGTRWLGTGWLASSSLVVTAGHCVYMHKHGGWVESIRIRLGVLAGDDGTIVAEAKPAITRNRGFRSVDGWTSDKDPECDYGAIFLAEPITGTYGHFLYQARSDSDLSKQLFNIDGYPADKPRYTQWFNGRQPAEVTARLLEYSFDTYHAESGGPLWDYVSERSAGAAQTGNRVVLGIHTRGGDLSNFGVRITEGVASNITGWSKGEIHPGAGA